MKRVTAVIKFTKLMFVPWLQHQFKLIRLLLCHRGYKCKQKFKKPIQGQCF